MISLNKKRARSAYVRCHSCMRDDHHTVLVRPPIRTILYALSVGLFRLVEPVRCEACGTVRCRGFRDAVKPEERWHAAQAKSTGIQG